MDAQISWQDANQRFLTAALRRLSHILDEASPARELERRPVDPMDPDAGADSASDAGSPPAETEARDVAAAKQAGSEDSSQDPELDTLRASMADPPALDRLATAFELSPFETDLLLLCAGIELDSALARRCAALNATGRPSPTFGLALALLPGAHWSALNPAAPLRRWRLLELGNGAAGEATLTSSPLRLDERILHFLTGIQYLDERLAGLVETTVPHRELVPSHQRLAERIAQAVHHENRDRRDSSRPVPVVQLTGPDTAAKTAVARTAAAALGLDLAWLRATAIPAAAAEIDGLQRLWQRESVLTGSALFLDWAEDDDSGHGRDAAVCRFVEDLRGLLFVGRRHPRRNRHRPTLSFEVRTPSADEQGVIWRQALAPASELLGLNGHLEGELEALVSQFRLETDAVHDAARQALAEVQDASAWAELDGPSPEDANPEDAILEDGLGPALWAAARHHSRPRVDRLAQPIESAASWDDLVLPREQTGLLQDLAAHVRQRFQVYQRWGFAAKGNRGLGISALFAGVSGTGKTLAAEVLANELQLDLYRIDLAAVISKYIGETEKNLQRVFDAADRGGAVLLFDEADALFGKRSEVKDSHDRYANVEISYLLQRMEAYRGLAILTTNMKSALDNAFLRRLRFVVEFPFPDAAQRAEIWRRIFPRETPTEGLDVAKLARLNVAGGNIRNIALGAAFAAADDGAPVGMEHLLRAARAEYRKMEKPLNEVEIRGWVS